MIYNIRRIIEYIYIDLPAPVAPAKRKEKERIRKIEDMLAHIHSKLGQVKSPVLAKKIEGMMQDIRAMIAKGDVGGAESAAEELEKFTSSAAEVTEKLFYNIQKAKTLFWSLPPQARRSLEVIIKAAEKMLASGGDLADMAKMNDKLERALYLAGRIADAGPGGLHTVGAELRELAYAAQDVCVMGTDHLALSDSALKSGADKAKGHDEGHLPEGKTVEKTADQLAEKDPEKAAQKAKDKAKDDPTQAQPGVQGRKGPKGPGRKPKAPTQPVGEAAQRQQVAVPKG